MTIGDQFRDLADDQLKHAQSLCMEQMDERLDALVAQSGSDWDGVPGDSVLDDLRNTLEKINAELKRRNIPPED
jgi:hypothetical protein